MSGAATGAAPAAPRARTAAAAGWWVLIGLGTLLLLNGLALYGFVETTGEGRTVGLLHAAFGALALVAALGGRAGEGRWSRRSGGVVAGSLALLALHMTAGGNGGIAAWYWALTAVAVGGQVLTRERR